MPVITLPDGSRREFDGETSPAQVAADIGPGLAKAAIGARINGELVDLSTPISEDVELALVTAGKKSDTPSEDCLFLMLTNKRSQEETLS